MSKQDRARISRLTERATEAETKYTLAEQLIAEQAKAIDALTAQQQPPPPAAPAPPPPAPAPQPAAAPENPHRAQYEELRRIDPYRASEYLLNYSREIYPRH